MNFTVQPQTPGETAEEQPMTFRRCETNKYNVTILQDQASKSHEKGWKCFSAALEIKRVKMCSKILLGVVLVKPKCILESLFKSLLH